MARDSVQLDDKKLQSIIRNYPAKAQLYWDGFTEDLNSRIKLSMGTSPSKPGDPPGVDTGSLRASMHWEHTGTMNNTISDGVQHGLWMEDGTEHVAPRPFMQPAFADAQKRLPQDIKDNLDIESL